MSPACGTCSRVSFSTVFSEVWSRAPISRRERPVTRHPHHGKLGRAGILDEGPPPAFSRDAAVLLDSGPRSRVSRPGSGNSAIASPVRPGVRRERESGRESATPYRASLACSCRNRCASRCQSRLVIRSTSRLTSISSLCRRGSCGDLRVRPGQERGQRAGEEASGSKGGVQVGRG